MITLLVPFLALIATVVATAGGATERLRRLGAVAWVAVLVVATIVADVALVRGPTLAVTAFVGGLLVVAGLLLHRPGHDVTRGRGGAPPEWWRSVIAGVVCCGTAALALFHVGVLEQADPRLSLVLEALTPSEFDPAELIRPAMVGSCIASTSRPTFERDRVVDCIEPHVWQVLRRVELDEPCGSSRGLVANVPIEVVGHDTEHDRWCLAHPAVASQRLAVPVCSEDLACTE